MSCYQTDNIVEEKFWVNDPMVLFRKNNFYKFFPTGAMNRIEIYNALTRFFIYLALIYLIFSTDASYILIPVLAILAIVILYYVGKRAPENFTCEKSPKTNTNPNEVFNPVNPITSINSIQPCQEPNRDNPFMNVTLEDLMSNRTRPPACSIMNNDIKQKINDNVYYDPDDMFDQNPTNRQFYTAPITTVPNDQTTFAKWLNEIPVTCKEDQRYCLRYEDIRFNRYNPYIDKTIPNDDTIV